MPLPDASGRADILRTLTRKTPLASGVDLRAVAHDDRCRNFSGADLQALVREAAMAALSAQFAAEQQRAARQATAGAVGGSGPAPPTPEVTQAHFNAAFAKVAPSVSIAEQRIYRRMKATLRRSHIKGDASTTQRPAAAAPPPASPIKPAA